MCMCIHTHTHTYITSFGFCSFVFFLRSHMQHMEVPRLAVKSELHLPAYAIATATPDTSQVCNLHCSSQQNTESLPLREATDQTYVFMGTSQFYYHWSTMGTPCIFFIHSSVNGYLDGFHVLAIVYSAVMNIGVWVSSQSRVFVFSTYMPRSEIVGSYRSSIFSLVLFCFVFVFLPFLGLLPCYMEVPRLGV